MRRHDWEIRIQYWRSGGKTGESGDKTVRARYNNGVSGERLGEHETRLGDQETRLGDQDTILEIRRQDWGIRRQDCESKI